MVPPHCPPTLPYKNAAVHTNFSKLHHTVEVSSLLLARRLTMEDNSYRGSSSSKRACSLSSFKSSVTRSSQISLLPDPSPKESMDEVWRDLSLSSPHPHSISANHVHATPTTHTHHDTVPGTTLPQDFTARPSSTSTTLSLPPPPTILLSLITPPLERPTPAFHSFNGLSASPSFPSFFMKKRPPENSDDKYSCDRRRKRLMKNRESAARSRARKQVSLCHVDCIHDVNVWGFFFFFFINSFESSFIRLTQTSWNWKSPT